MLEQGDMFMKNHRFVHAVRGNRHRLQGLWIGTCSCETSGQLSCLQTREEDRESPASTICSSWIKKQNNRRFKLICNRTTHVVKNQKCYRDMGNVELFELSCSECLFFWNQGIVCLWKSLERKCHPTFSPMPIGRFLIRELRCQEGATSRCSAR